MIDNNQDELNKQNDGSQDSWQVLFNIVYSIKVEEAVFAGGYSPAAEQAARYRRLMSLSADLDHDRLQEAFDVIQGQDSPPEVITQELKDVAFDKTLSYFGYEDLVKQRKLSKQEIRVTTGVI